MKYQTIDIEYLKELKERKQLKKELNLMIKGIQYGFLVFTIIILVFYGLSGNIALAQTQDVDYIWNENVLYDDSLTASESEFNRAYPKTYDGEYLATYSFTDDVHGSYPTNWSTRQTGGSVKVIGRKTNHSKVIELDDIGSNYVYARRDFTNTQVNGTIEFYYLTTDTTKTTQIRFKGGFDTAIDIDIDNSKFRYFTGTFHDITDALSNTWYHLSINYECSTGGYDGLLQYDWNIKIDGIEYGDYNFFQNADYIDEFYVGSLNPESNYQIYIDAVGFYPNDVNYVIGDNLIEQLSLLDTNSVVLDYSEITYDQDVIGDVSDTWNLGNDSLKVIGYENFGRYFVNLDFDVWLHSIYNITDLAFSYNITTNETVVNGLVQLHVETTSNYNYSTQSLYGINESIGSFPDDLIAYDIRIVADSDDSFELYIDYLRFDYNLLVDKYEFAFNSTGSLNLIGDDDVNTWSDIEGVYNYPDVVNCYYSDDSLDRSIRIHSNGDGWAGIEKTFTNNTGSYYNITWQLDVNEWGAGGHIDAYHDVIIYSYDQTEIFHLRIEGISYDELPHEAGDAFYYNGTEYIWFTDGILPRDNLDFSLAWIHNDYDNFTFSIEGIEYSIPSLDNTKIGFGKMIIRSMIDDYAIWSFIDYEIDSIGVHIDGLPYNDDGYTDQLFYYLSVETWNMNEHNFVQFDFDPLYNNNISIYVNGAYEVIAFQETLYLLDYWKNYYGEGNYPYPYLEIFNGTGVSGYGDMNVKIYGIMLVDSLTSTEFVPSFTYNNVDIQNSYFYVENDQLKYTLTTNEQTTEYIQLNFDISDLYSRNKSFSINHQKDIPNLFAEVKIIYTDSTFSYFESEVSVLFENTILPQDKIIDNFQFLITDNDNDYMDTITGYFSEITLIYYPNIDTILPIINFIAVIPILVILFIIPLYIYIRFKVSWIFLPMVMLFAIIGTGAGIIPLWLTVVIIFSVVSFYIIQKKREV